MTTLTQQLQPRRYEVTMHPEMDEDMEKLAKRLHVDRYEVFHYAMALYMELKNRQLDQEMEDPESPLRVFLENSKGRKIEFRDPLKLTHSN